MEKKRKTSNEPRNGKKTLGKNRRNRQDHEKSKKAGKIMKTEKKTYIHTCCRLSLENGNSVET